MESAGRSDASSSRRTRPHAAVFPDSGHVRAWPPAQSPGRWRRDVLAIPLLPAGVPDRVPFRAWRPLLTTGHVDVEHLQPSRPVPFTGFLSGVRSWLGEVTGQHPRPSADLPIDAGPSCRSGSSREARGAGVELSGRGRQNGRALPRASPRPAPGAALESTEPSVLAPPFVSLSDQRPEDLSPGLRQKHGAEPRRSTSRPSVQGPPLVEA